VHLRVWTRVKIVVCIPARYESTRFPGKVLAQQTGKFLVQHTYEQARKARLPERVIIAADDERIVSAARTFDAECVLTRVDHQSGTDRIAEAVAEVDADIVINVQGDEPNIDPSHIDQLAQMLVNDPDAPMATLATRLSKPEQVADPNIVKAIISSCAVRDASCDNPQSTIHNPQSAKAIYFSRCPIPYDRAAGGIGPAEQYLRHIGIYAYRKDFLRKLTTLAQTPLEKLEKLEQLRVIENGFAILVGIVEDTSEGIDTPEQYAAFVARYKNNVKTDPEDKTAPASRGKNSDG